MQWKISDDFIDYEQAIAEMEARVAAIYAGEADELVWLLEHPPLYTAGTSAKSEDLLDSARFPVYKAGRGGQYTYHGPGQRVGYVMRNLKRGEGSVDLRAYVRQLEEWLIQTLAVFDVQGERREGRVGIWVVMPDGRESKIAALGVRVRRGITYHGVSLNVCPDLSHFSGIVPCGLATYGVTSLKDLGIDVEMADVDHHLKQQFSAVFEA